VLTRSGETAVDYRGKPFAVYERLPGTVLCQARVTADVTRRVGAALAGVHRAPLGGLVVPDGRFDFDGIVSRLDRVEASGREDLMPGVRRARALVDRLSQERNTELPQGLIHGDLFRDNVLILDGRVSGLLDFESACRGPYVYDLMVTLLAWCFGDGFDAALVRAMVEGYVAERPLGANEVSAMVSEASVACLRFVATRLTDFSLRVAQGQSPVRDYQRFFLRLEALEAGILHSTLDGLF
jgi:homoserine kinase type II